MELEYFSSKICYLWRSIYSDTFTEHSQRARQVVLWQRVSVKTSVLIVVMSFKIALLVKRSIAISATEHGGLAALVLHVPAHVSSVFVDLSTILTRVPHVAVNLSQVPRTIFAWKKILLYSVPVGLFRRIFWSLAFC